MPIDYNDSVKAQRMAVVMQAIDAADPNPGKLVLVLREGTTYVDLATIPFAMPSFQNEGNGIITMRAGPRTVNAAATGTVVTARIEDGATPPNIVGSGLRVDVTAASNPDVLVSSIHVTAGNLVTVYSGTITHG